MRFCSPTRRRGARSGAAITLRSRRCSPSSRAARRGGGPVSRRRAARRRVRRGECLALAPWPPERGGGAAVEGADLSKEYSSSDAILGCEETRSLLSSHGLLLEQDPAPEEDGELLR